jgi:hypothetical protein
MFSSVDLFVCFHGVTHIYFFITHLCFTYLPAHSSFIYQYFCLIYHSLVYHFIKTLFLSQVLFIQIIILSVYQLIYLIVTHLHTFYPVNLFISFHLKAQSYFILFTNFLFLPNRSLVCLFKKPFFYFAFKLRTAYSAGHELWNAREGWKQSCVLVSAG